MAGYYHEVVKWNYNNSRSLGEVKALSSHMQQSVFALSNIEICTMHMSGAWADLSPTFTCIWQEEGDTLAFMLVCQWI